MSVADRVLRAGRAVPWAGTAWRIHGSTWDPDDPGGSLVESGRWNRAEDLFPKSEIFPVLYTSSAPGLADWEFIAHSRRTDPDEMWRRFRTAQRSRFQVSLPSTLDLRDPSSVGLTLDDLTQLGPAGYQLPQAIAAAAYARGYTGLLVPSATKMGDLAGDHNVIVFFNLTGKTKLRYGMTVLETEPRRGISIVFHGKETPNLPT